MSRTSNRTPPLPAVPTPPAITARRGNPHAAARVAAAQPVATEAVVPTHASIELRAYFRAQQRGFAPGHELEDWLSAEAELTGKEVAASGALQ